MTHLLDQPLPPLVGTHFDGDQALHDLRLLRPLDRHLPLLARRAGPIAAVRAHEYRPPNQPAELTTPVAAWVEILCEDGANALIRGVGDARTRAAVCPFWVHGTEGTIRGSVLVGAEFVELERDGITTRFALEGAGIPKGSPARLRSSRRAIAEDREPFNSARHNLLSLAITLAACRSAEEDSRLVSLDELP